MSPFIPPAAFIRFLDTEGAIMPFGKLFFYLTGTLTETPVYDADGDPLAQPVLADITGQWPQVYLDPDVIYRVRLENAAGVEQGDVDPWSGITASGIITDDGRTVQEVLETTPITADPDLIDGTNLAVAIQSPVDSPTHIYGGFSATNDFGIGSDFTDFPINQHAGPTTVTNTIVAPEAPLFFGVTLRPNGEAGGDTGRTMVSLEAWRQNNTVGYQDMGSFRILSEGVTAAKMGGRAAILLRPDNVTTVAGYHERFSVSAPGTGVHVLIANPTVSGIGVNRTGVPATSALVTLGSGGGVTMEYVTSTDGSGQLLADHLGVLNTNSGGSAEKRACRIQFISAGGTANQRGGQIIMQVKADAGALATAMTLSNSAGTTAVGIAGQFGCNGSTPQSKVTLPADGSDPATTQALVNAIKVLLIANGQAQ